MLKKSLYGVKQYSRQWNQRFYESIKGQGFTRGIHNPCVYFKRKNVEDTVFLLLYVDDMLMAFTDIGKIKKLKGSLKSGFKMKDLGKSTIILDMYILCDRKKGVLKFLQENT